MKKELKISAGQTHTESQLFDTEGSHSCRISLAEKARLDLVALVFANGDGDDSDRPVHLDLTVDLEGEGAEFNLHGLYMAAGRGHAYFNVKVNHLVPGCVSRQLIKGIAAGEATGKFSGLIYVASGARLTDAMLHNRNLQLSDTASVFSRPQLEIYADDVRCGHGATIGRLDEEAIYYMRQRGVDEREARRMQLKGFVDDIINHCSSGSFRDTAAEKAGLLIAEF